MAAAQEQASALDKLLAPKFRSIAFIKVKQQQQQQQTTMMSLLGVVQENLLTLLLAIHAEYFGYESGP